MNIELGSKLFSFTSMQDWINNASTAWKSAGVPADRTICIDQKGRICEIGNHFRSAEHSGAYPIDVYNKRINYFEVILEQAKS